MYGSIEYSSWAVEQMNMHADELCMSHDNLTESLIRLQDKQPRDFSMLEEGCRILTLDKDFNCLSREILVSPYFR